MYVLQQAFNGIGSVKVTVSETNTVRVVYDGMISRRPVYDCVIEQDTGERVFYSFVGLEGDHVAITEWRNVALRGLLAFIEDALDGKEVYSGVTVDDPDDATIARICRKCADATAWTAKQLKAAQAHILAELTRGG